MVSFSQFSTHCRGESEIERSKGQMTALPSRLVLKTTTDCRQWNFDFHLQLHNFKTVYGWQIAVAQLSYPCALAGQAAMKSSVPMIAVRINPKKPASQPY